MSSIVLLTKDHPRSLSPPLSIYQHKCTSATCPICTSRRGSTFFVPAIDDDEGEAYEVDYYKSGAPSSDPNGSFEYRPSEPGASRPGYENPAEIGRRPYEVEDTVEF